MLEFRLLIPVFFLCFISIFNIFGIKNQLFVNQAVFTFAGFFIYFAAKKIGRNFFLTNNRLFYWFFIFILLVISAVGVEVRGSKRWLGLFIFNFQGSEFFKPFFILFFADLLSFRKDFTNPLKIFSTSLFYFILPTFIIFKQPDLGNALVYCFIFLMMILFSDLPKKYLIYLIFLLVIFLPSGWFFLKDYQKERLLSFFNPHLDSQGAAYNMIQSIITVGSGNFLGKGLGLGTQSRLYFLPENHTDFAFASLIEQFGFIGGVTLLILYTFIVFYIFKKIFIFSQLKENEDKKIFLYTVGFVSLLVFQIFVNIGMNMGLFPITGISLPFISYGGSSFAALMIGIAFLP